MAWQDNFHSRFVAWMKIILPLAALGLLSTLFLISRNFDPTKSIPIAEIDLEQRAQDQGATNAAFAGVTRGGDEVLLKAEAARPDADDPRLIHAETISAQIKLKSGAVIDVTSDRADMHQSRYSATLEGNVVLETSTGYRMTSDQIDTRFDDLYAETPGPVEGYGPPGELSAGRMVLQGDQAPDSAHLLFTDGVKLIYTPQISEE